MTKSANSEQAVRAAHYVRDSLPNGGLFAGVTWRTAVTPFGLDPTAAKEIESLGRVLLQFYRAVNLLYRKSVEGKMPQWVAHWLDLGKPPEVIARQRDPAFRNDVPRVIRPDILLTDGGLSITELDSVPGGIGLTAWLNRTYTLATPHLGEANIVGGAEGMLHGFESIFGDANHVHLVVSEEAATYRPEMEWITAQLGSRFTVRDSQFDDFKEGDAVYRFFELFDLPNVRNADAIFEQAKQKRIHLTPPPKPIFEEKMLFALLWNRHLQDFWRQELGESFFSRLKRHVPYTWLMDPAPLPPHAAIPQLGITDWRQLQNLSQKERELIVKVSGFSAQAWGARGVYLGSDLSHADWSFVVAEALRQFPYSPCVLQRFHKPTLKQIEWYDFGCETIQNLNGRTRLCPYFFVSGKGDAARPALGGILATVCPADKKIIHGMNDAVIAPCRISN